MLVLLETNVICEIDHVASYAMLDSKFDFFVSMKWIYEYGLGSMVSMVD